MSLLSVAVVAVAAVVAVVTFVAIVAVVAVVTQKQSTLLLPSFSFTNNQWLVIAVVAVGIAIVVAVVVVVAVIGCCGCCCSVSVVVDVVVVLCLQLYHQTPPAATIFFYNLSVESITVIKNDCHMNKGHCHRITCFLTSLFLYKPVSRITTIIINACRFFS